MRVVTKRLGDIATVFNGKTPSKAEQRDTGFPVLKIKDVSETGQFRGAFTSFVDESMADKHSGRWIHSGDTLILNAAHNADYVASKMFLAADNVAGVLPTGEWLLVRPNVAEAIPEYLYYWIRSTEARAKIRFIVKGIHLYPKDVAELGVPWMPLSEQRRIVDILSRAEGVVRLRREAEKKAAELIPALFLDMFGDPAMNPRGWAVVPVSNLCDKCSTTDPRKTPQAGFTYIDIAAIDNDRGSIVEPKPVLGADAPSRARQVVKAGDVIVSTVRPNLRGSAMVPDDLDGQICSTGFCVLRPRATATSAYVFALVRSDWFVDEIMKKVRGAQYPAVTDKDLFGHPVPLPSLSFQQQFSMRFADIIAIQSQQSAATATAQAAFDALLSEVFQG